MIPHPSLPVLCALALAAVSPAWLLADPAPSGAARWEKEISAIEARRTESPAQPGALLFVGSSSIRLWDLEGSWPGKGALNHGFGGSNLSDTVHFFDRIIAPYQPRAVIVYAGDNDVAKNRTADEVAADFQTLAGLVGKKLPGVPLVYIAIKPSIKRWNLWPEMKRANEAIAALCASAEHLHFADIAAPMLEAGETAPPAKEWFKEDGLHLSPSGYARWTAVVNEALREAGVEL